MKEWLILQQNPEVSAAMNDIRKSLLKILFAEWFAPKWINMKNTYNENKLLINSTVAVTSIALLSYITLKTYNYFKSDTKGKKIEEE